MKASSHTLRNMTSGPISGHLLAFAVPLFLGNLLQQLYNMVDSWVVGKYVSEAALADFTHTAYPPLDAFTLQVELQSDTLPKGETFVLECSLKNDSGENYYLQQLPDFIGYTYNDYSEYALALGDFTYFRSGEEITRLIEIPATESGTITITADFDVCLSPGSQTSQPYQYIQDFEVTVE